jgi:hypothetical protein
LKICTLGWFLAEIVSIDEDCCHVRYEDDEEENYLPDELDDLDNIVANVSSTVAARMRCKGEEDL